MPQDPGAALAERQARLAQLQSMIDTNRTMAQADATRVEPSQEAGRRPDEIRAASGSVRPMMRRELAQEGPAGAMVRATDLLQRVTGLGGEAGPLGLLDPSRGVGAAISFGGLVPKGPRQFATREGLWEAIRKLPDDELLEVHRILEMTPFESVHGPIQMMPHPSSVGPRFMEPAAVTEGFTTTAMLNREILQRMRRGENPQLREYAQRQGLFESGENIGDILRGLDTDILEGSALIEALGLPFILP